MKQSSDSKIKAFYISFEWRKLRYATLLRFDRKCMCCGNENEIIHVDHIKPIRRFWHLRLDPENVQVLCELCNHGKGSWDESDFRNQFYENNQTTKKPENLIKRQTKKAASPSARLERLNKITKYSLERT